MHQATAVVQRTGRGATDRDELAERNARLARARASGVTERTNDRVGAFAWGPPHVARDDLVTVAIEHGDDGPDVRAAKVDAEEAVVAQTLGSLPASSGEDSALASPSRTLFCAALYPFFALSLPNCFSASAKIVVTRSAR